MLETRLRRLDEIAHVVTGGTPKASEIDSWGTAIDFITPGDQTENVREAQPKRRLSEVGASRLSSRVVPARSTNLTCIGYSIGKVSRSTNSAVTNQQINSLVAIDGLSDPDFLYYLIKNWSAVLRSHAAGSVTPIVKKSALAAYVFPVPEILEQRSIARVLTAFDDKIQLNREVAAVSADLSSAKLAAAAMRGGSSVSIAEASETVFRGITPDYSQNADNSMLVVNQKCIRGQRVLMEVARRTDLSRVKTAKILQAEDVLINSMGDGTLGRAARWTLRTRAVPDALITVVRFDPLKVDVTCAGHALLAKQSQLQLMGEGSTGQTQLPRGELLKLQLKVPSREASEVLGKELRTSSAMEDALLAENYALAESRDALLPLLLSGTVSLRDSESFAESVL